MKIKFLFPLYIVYRELWMKNNSVGVKTIRFVINKKLSLIYYIHITLAKPVGKVLLF